MKEIIVISGKGGTGKTSIVASLAALASREGVAVLADCDVDAADLHLVLAPRPRGSNDFVSGRVARVDGGKCLSTGEEDSCARCAELCRFGAVRPSFKTGREIDEGVCEGCGVCVSHCPAHAIEFLDRHCGEWYVSDTRFGTLAHAVLDARAENSGKLVTTVRREAKKAAETEGADWIIVDGSPGTGCPVIASITGADAVLIVAEPTVSGRHDLERVASLARHFSIPFSVCVNKADINVELSDGIRDWCVRNGAPFLGEIPHDPAVTRAQLQGKSVIEYCESEGVESKVPAAIAGIWESICQ